MDYNIKCVFIGYAMKMFYVFEYHVHKFERHKT